MLRGMFLGGNGLADSGVALSIGANGETVVVRMRLGTMLGDEDALNSMFFIKGASGACPCGTLCLDRKNQVGDTLVLQSPQLK